MRQGPVSELYDVHAVRPTRGHCVLFSHNLIHESISPTFESQKAAKEEDVEAMEEEKEEVIPSNRRTSARLRNTKSSKRAQDQAKKSAATPKMNENSNSNNAGCGGGGAGRERFVLRSDLMTKRMAKPLGFSLDETGLEFADYELALNFFRDAQRTEVEQSDSALAGSLYERALSLRYAYPKRLIEMKAMQESDRGQCGVEIERKRQWSNLFPGTLVVRWLLNSSCLLF
jgi:hypothetical protein